MIIQIRGTSGSGKTTIVRRVAESLGGFESFSAVYLPKKRTPLYYIASKYNLAILGSYANLCGGVDRVQAMGGYSLFQRAVKECEGYTILMEGLILSEDVKQSLLISNFKRRARVLFLTTSVEECIARVNERRKLHNRSRPLDISILSKRVDTIERARRRLLEAGITCRRYSSDQAPRVILKLIKSGCSKLR